MPERQPPIVVEAADPAKDRSNGAAIIFMHGLGGDGLDWKMIADQFQSIKRLPYMKWIFPTALENRDAMTTAWYAQVSLLSVPPSRPELVEDEDEDGMLLSMKYIEGLISDLQTNDGIPPERVVLAGFSQGCAMTLLTGLVSGKYADKLAGLIGICGYLPLSDRLVELRKENGLPAEYGAVPIYVARGGADRLVPSRFHQMAQDRLKEIGYRPDLCVFKTYEGVVHEVSPSMMQDMCFFLERVLPPKE